MSTTNTATPWASTEETVTAEHKAAMEKAQKELAARTLSKLAELESACKLACIVACIAAPRGSVVDGLAGEAKYNAVTESFEAAFAGLRELIGA